MILTSYVFKPKHPEIAEKVLKSFVNNWLHWDEAGAWLVLQEINDGYVKLTAETENPDLEMFSETCWREDPVEGHHLANDLMVFLDEEGFFNAPHIDKVFTPEEAEENKAVSGYGTENPKHYSFYEEELASVIFHLAQNNSRVVNFWEDDRVFIMDRGAEGERKCSHARLLDYVLSMPTSEDAISFPPRENLV